MQDYLIRRAEMGDVKAVHSFICELEDRQFELERFSACYGQNLVSEHNIYLVAERSGEILGLLTCHGQTLLHHLGIVYEIQELIVKKDSRSEGIGSVLIGYLEKELQDMDYEMLEVSSNLKRIRAHGFYEKEGFKPTHYKFTKARIQ